MTLIGINGAPCKTKHPLVIFYRASYASMVLAVIVCLSVCLSICLSVCHKSELYKDGYT